MKKSHFLFLILFLSCNPKKDGYRKAEDALDAGREFINAQLQGDFAKASFYLVSDPLNKTLLDNREKSYRERDREGRQQWRTASINILEVKQVNDTMACMFFQNSFDKVADTLCIVKRTDTWLVDISRKN